MSKLNENNLLNIYENCKNKILNAEYIQYE